MSLAIKAGNFLYQTVSKRFEDDLFLNFEKSFSLDEMEFLAHHYHLLGQDLINILEGILDFILEPNIHKQTHLIKKIIQTFQIEKFSCYKKSKKNLLCIFSNVQTPEKISLKDEKESLSIDDIANSRYFEGYFKDRKGFFMEIGQLVLFGTSSHSQSMPKALTRYLNILFKFVFMRELRS